MKVLHYIPSIDRASGGVGSYIQLLTKPLGKLVELHVVTHQSENELDLENCHLHYIDKWTHYLSMKKQWIDLLNNITPDVVHVNCCWQPESALVQRWSSYRGFKTVYTPHGMLEPWIIKRHYWTRKVPALLFYQKAAIKKSNIIHATAESERQNLLQLGYNKKIAVIPNGIDVNIIKMKSCWERTKTLLFLSRVHVKKGLDILINVVAELKENMREYHVLIAGEGEESYIAELRNLIKQKGLEKMIDIIGGVYGDKKWTLYQKADVFVLPTHSENFGIVVAEALASGTPVITTQGTPWKDLQECHCGWWTETGIEPIKQALQSFLQLSEEELQNMGIRGRKLMEERYSVEAIALKMRELYEWVLKEGLKPNFIYI